MGLKTDLIKAFEEASKLDGVKKEDINTDKGSSIEIKARLMTEAITNFLEEAKFRITKLNANVVLENWTIPDQFINIPIETLTAIQEPLETALRTIADAAVPGLSATVIPVLQEQIKLAVLPKTIASGILPSPRSIDQVSPVGKDGGGLISDGYAYIAGDPVRQANFDVETEDSTEPYTTVKFFLDDNQHLID